MDDNGKTGNNMAVDVHSSRRLLEATEEETLLLLILLGRDILVPYSNFFSQSLQESCVSFH